MNQQEVILQMNIDRNYKNASASYLPALLKINRILLDDNNVSLQVAINLYRKVFPFMCSTFFHTFSYFVHIFSLNNAVCCAFLYGGIFINFVKTMLV